jgi:hypothetical protein
MGKRLIIETLASPSEKVASGCAVLQSVPMHQCALLRNVVLAMSLAALPLLLPGCLSGTADPPALSGRERVGRLAANRYYTPVNQVLTPAGLQVELPGLRPQAIALSPNGRLLVTSGKTASLIAVDPATGKVLQRVALPSEWDQNFTNETASAHNLYPDTKGQVSFTGLVFSPDGTRLYMANVQGSIKVFAVGADNQITGLGTIQLQRLMRANTTMIFRLAWPFPRMARSSTWC